MGRRKPGTGAGTWLQGWVSRSVPGTLPAGALISILGTQNDFSQGQKIKHAGSRRELQAASVARAPGSQQDGLGVAVPGAPWGAAGPGALGSARPAWGARVPPPGARVARSALRWR